MVYIIIIAISQKLKMHLSNSMQISTCIMWTSKSALSNLGIFQVTPHTDRVTIRRKRYKIIHSEPVTYLCQPLPYYSLMEQHFIINFLRHNVRSATYKWDPSPSWNPNFKKYTRSEVPESDTATHRTNNRREP